jgi:Fic family protein
MLFRAAKLGTQEIEVGEAISKAYRSLRNRLSTPARWYGVLRRNTFARAVRGSNSIEGYKVSAEDAIAAVEGEEPLTANEETWHAVVGYRIAMTYVLQLAKDSNFVFNDGFLRSLHYMMVHYDLSKHPGNWRPGPIYVRDEDKGETVYEAPSADRVPKLIDELLKYLVGKEDEDHAIIKAAMAHLNLAMIHPFSDGNGRMARCLQTLVLAERGIGDPTFSSIEEYLGANTQDYYNVLAEVGKGKWNPQNDTRPWIRFTLTAHYRQAATLIRRTKMIAKLWDELEKVIEAHSLHPRAIVALNDAAVGYHVRPSHYKNAAEVSKVVASRDLKALVDAGLLIPSGEKRGRIYTGADSLRAIANKIRSEEPKHNNDPFEAGANLFFG